MGEIRRNQVSCSSTGPPCNVEASLQTPNLAYNRTATQSSTTTAGEAEGLVFSAAMAVDDDQDTFSRTACPDADPWWEVDLDGVYFIRQIILFNRPDCCTEELSNATVHLLQENGTDTSIGTFTLVRTGGEKEVVTESIGNTTWIDKIRWSFSDSNAEADPPTRRVRVALPPERCLQLANVVVYGIPA